MRNYFNDELHRIYYEGSAINSAFSKIDASQLKVAEHQQKVTNGDYVDDTQRERAEQAVEKACQDAEKAKRDLERKRTNAESIPGNVIGRIITRIQNERAQTENEPHEETPERQAEHEPKQKTGYRTDKLSQYSKKERKLISRIFSVILSATDEKSAEKIIAKIEDELQ